MSPILRSKYMARLLVESAVDNRVLGREWHSGALGIVFIATAVAMTGAGWLQNQETWRTKVNRAAPAFLHERELSYTGVSAFSFALGKTAPLYGKHP